MRDGAGSRRACIVSGAAVIGLYGCALALGVGSLGVAGAVADSSTLTITYTTPNSLQVTLGNGTVVGSGTVIPAGSYMVSVKDDPNTGDLNPDLTITGPGVSVSNDLNSTGMGIDATSTFGPYTFQTSSSYSIEDTTIGASSLVTFTTTATASAPTVSTSSVSTTSTGPAQATTTTTAAPAGSKPAKVLGTLKGSVGAPMKPTLTFDGKAVKTLKAGRYTVTVEDRSRKVGLILGESSRQATTTLSGAAAVGLSSHTVSLSVGRWFFEASAKGPRTYFNVSE